MGRRRKGRPVHGWLNLDKPVGPTSTQALARVRRAFDARKAGHAGTLDPLADGVLPIAFGEATKTIPYMQNARKTYRFTVRWGERRDSEDAAGALLARNDERPDAAAIETALPQFTGRIDQVPPKFSAVKVDGARAYDLARAGEGFDLAAKPVTLHSFRLIERPDDDHAAFEAETGKGAYIRALARDLADQLGVLGYVSALTRLNVGGFARGQAISLEKIVDFGDKARAEEVLLPVHAALDDIPAMAVTDDETTRLRNGGAVSLLRMV
ncbi:MAG: tRNA pseudouridine(55) synthase TruB, partial [Pseudomonadota bacterium]